MRGAPRSTVPCLRSITEKRKSSCHRIRNCCTEILGWLSRRVSLKANLVRTLRLRCLVWPGFSATFRVNRWWRKALASRQTVVAWTRWPTRDPRKCTSFTDFSLHAALTMACNLVSLSYGKEVINVVNDGLDPSVAQDPLKGLAWGAKDIGG